MSMRTELVSIPTDTFPLDGAYYTPADRPAVGAVLFIHGNTMNFYVGAPRFLPPALVELGYACLAFNRRGHGILAVRDGRLPEGGARQMTADSIADNELAAAFLADRGHPPPVVVGHSYGGLLAARFVLDHPEVPALVLLSANQGGRAESRTGPPAGAGDPGHDAVDASGPPAGAGDPGHDAVDASGPRMGGLSKEQEAEALARAEQLVADGRGDDLLLVGGWWYVVSAASLLDRHANALDLLAMATSIRCPTLFIRGDQESPVLRPAERFRDVAAGPCEVHVIPDGDHFYTGKEDQVTRIVSQWMGSL